VTRYAELSPGSIVLRDGDEAPVPPGHARVAVSACGVCGTDLHLLSGVPLPPGVDYPLRPGHEVAGTVVELGPGVEPAIGLGVQVVLHPLAPCGTCASCRGDQAEYCARPEILGIHRAGGLATDVVWPAARMVAAPGVDPRHAAILADAVATANRALDLAQLHRGGRLCVLGAGGVGTHVLELARLADPEAGLTGVVRSESSAARLAVAGFDSVVGLDIGRLRHPDGYDAVVDFSGDAGAPALGVRLLRPGGRFVFGSVLDGDLDVGAAQRIQARELTVVGVFSSSLADLRTVTDLLTTGTLDVAASVTHEFALSDVKAAFETIDGRPPGLVRAVVLGD
jgi:2-desacetyl-2-hydroxyethyl bacteriochlorophyllide A dehydrogenase